MLVCVIFQLPVEYTQACQGHDALHTSCGSRRRDAAMAKAHLNSTISPRSIFSAGKYPVSRSTKHRSERIGKVCWANVGCMESSSTRCKLIAQSPSTTRDPHANIALSTISLSVLLRFAAARTRASIARGGRVQAGQAQASLCGYIIVGAYRLQFEYDVRLSRWHVMVTCGVHGCWVSREAMAAQLATRAASWSHQSNQSAWL